MNIKSDEAQRLAHKLAEMTGESLLQHLQKQSVSAWKECRRCKGTGSQIA